MLEMYLDNKFTQRVFQLKLTQQYINHACPDFKKDRMTVSEGQTLDRT